MRGRDVRQAVREGIVASNEPKIQIGFDRPLSPTTALVDDKLGRRRFAQAAADALGQVGAPAGLVLSIEGSWGSGKTSTLAMMQAILQSNRPAPVIVHFNPWLVGDRDALLRQFLTRIAAEVKLEDRSADGKKVARELKAYSKVFDFIRLVPGAEPWASLVKTVIETAGEAVGAVSTHKAPDLEAQKSKVEEALREYSRPIVVFIDDMDRLFPLEVFEMVRIIKAVGDLPNVGYVLAWDPVYVSGALNAAKVPQAEHYLDKIVQVRMPLPAIALEARGVLLNEALARLPPDAHKSYFANDQDRLGMLYFSGLRELLEQPRDVARTFNTVAVIEPALRGEVVLADIIGLAALMVKASRVYELIRKQPRWFVGLLPGDHSLLRKSEELVAEGAKEREAAFSKCSAPQAVRDVVHRLFPQTAKADDEFTMGRVSDVEGHIAAPTRLLVALQLHVSGSDVSFVLARRYLLHAEQRDRVARELTQQNCLEFMESLGDVADSTAAEGVADVDELCLAVARLADVEPFPTRARDRSGFFRLPVENVAVRAIHLIVKAAAQERAAAIAERIVADAQALTVAMELFVRSFLTSKDDKDGPRCALGAKDRLAGELAKNILNAAKLGELLATCNPGFLLWNLSRIAEAECHKVFAAIKAVDPSLDGFVLAILGGSYDSTKGQRYSLPTDRSKLEAYCPLDEFKDHARLRLADTTMGFPARAAWKSVVEEKSVYGVDGSIARD